MTNKLKGEQRRAILLAQARDLEITWRRPTAGHFKLYELNYWPSTGVYYFDNTRKSGHCSPSVASTMALAVLARRRHFEMNAIPLLDE